MIKPGTLMKFPSSSRMIIPKDGTLKGILMYLNSARRKEKQNKSELWYHEFIDSKGRKISLSALYNIQSWIEKEWIEIVND